MPRRDSKRSHEDRESSSKRRRRDESNGGGSGGGSKDEIVLSVDETNELRKKLGLKPLQVDNGAGAAASKPAAAKSGGDSDEIVLSVEETNELRKSLGLKPLDVTTSSASTRKEIYVDPRAQQTKEESESEEESTIDQGPSLGAMLLKQKGGRAEDWVKQSKLRVKKEESKKKKKPARRKAGADGDDSDSTDEEEEREREALRKHRERTKAYSSQHLEGMRIHHKGDLLSEGQTVLTLADQALLDEDQEDVLQNVELAEKERYLKANETKRKAKKPVYSGYDDSEFSEDGKGRGRSLLAQYDEEEEEEGIRLGRGGSAKLESDLPVSAMEEENVETLTLGSKVASDFFSKEEMEAKKAKKLKKKMKKQKKGGKRRGKAVAELLEEEAEEDTSEHLGSRASRGKQGESDAGAEAADKHASYARAVAKAEAKAEAVLVKGELGAQAPKTAQDELANIRRQAREEGAHPSLSKVKEEGVSKVSDTGHRVYSFLGGDEGDEDMEEDDAELYASLQRAARSARASTVAAKEVQDTQSAEAAGATAEEEEEGGEDAAAKVAAMVRSRQQEEAKKGTRGGVSFSVSGVAEFSRRLQGAMEERAEEQAQARRREARLKAGLTDIGGAMPAASASASTADAGAAAAATETDHTGLGEDIFGPSKSTGSVLEMLRRTGDLKPRQTIVGRANDPKEDVAATTKEPKLREVKLEYKDEKGRLLSTKEAYRQMSYAFHGQKPGKKKQEKRQRELARARAAERRGAKPGVSMRALSTQQRRTGQAFLTLG